MRCPAGGAGGGARAAPVLVLGHDGRVSVHHNRLGSLADPAPARVSVPRVLAAARRPTVIGELKRLLAAGAIDLPTYQARRATYEDVRRVARRLSGRDELIGLAVDRAGGKAWEYLFSFDGGRPPWVSSLAQGTALQALARAAIRLGRQAELWPLTHAGLAVFQQPPPAGVRVASVSGVGAHYLQYSFDDDLFILNGFVQSLNGLGDYAGLAGDGDAAALFADGVAAARGELPAFDTGAWSLYSRGDETLESDLGYHKLLRDFVRGLCERTADAVFCGARANLDRYLVEKPPLALLTRRLRGGRDAALRLSLSKISRVSVRVTRADGAPVLVRSGLLLGYGRRAIGWAVPRRRGVYSVALSAVDLAGNAQGITGTVEVLKPKRRR